MDPIAPTAPDQPDVQVNVQDVVNILTQRIAQLELSNAAQQAHIGALLARLAAYADQAEAEGEQVTAALDELVGPGSIVADLEAIRQAKAEETEGIPPEQE